MSNMGSTERIIDGKKYYKRVFGSKVLCERVAEQWRKRGHSTRIIQGYEEYAVYSRRGK